MSKNVIDISKYNGSIDWSKVVKDDVDAVIIRAGYRGYGSSGNIVSDSKFEDNIKGALDAGLPVGVYWVSQALSEEEAEEEAEYLINLLEDYEITYPVYLDSEYSNTDHDGRADGLTKAKRTKYGLAFCEAISDAGYIPGLYCSDSWYDDELDGDDFYDAGYSIWIARYSSRKPTVDNYDGWQYTDDGDVSGISGDVDKSYFYTDYATDGSIDVSGSDEEEEEEEDENALWDKSYRDGIALYVDIKKSSRLNMRDYPGTSGKVIKKLKRNDKLTFYGWYSENDDSSWIKVRAENGTEGWVWRDYTQDSEID